MSPSARWCQTPERCNSFDPQTCRHPNSLLELLRLVPPRQTSSWQIRLDWFSFYCCCLALSEAFRLSFLLDEPNLRLSHVACCSTARNGVTASHSSSSGVSGLCYVHGVVELPWWLPPAAESAHGTPHAWFRPPGDRKCELFQCTQALWWAGGVEWVVSIYMVSVPFQWTSISGLLSTWPSFLFFLSLSLSISLSFVFII